MNKEQLERIESLLQELYNIGIAEENEDITGTVGEVLAIIRNE